MPGLLEWNVYFATVLCMVQLRSAQVSLPPFNISLCTAKDAHLYRGYPSPGVQIWTKCTYPVPGNGWHNCRGSGKALFCDPDQILSEKEVSSIEAQLSDTQLSGCTDELVIGLAMVRVLPVIDISGRHCRKNDECGDVYPKLNRSNDPRDPTPEEVHVSLEDYARYLRIHWGMLKCRNVILILYAKDLDQYSAMHIATGDATPSPTTDVTDYSDVDGHFRDNKLGVALETLIKKYKLEFATPKAPAKEESSYTGVIVGIIVALVVIALIVTGVVCYRKGNCPYRYRFWSTLSEPVVSA